VLKTKEQPNQPVDAETVARVERYAHRMPPRVMWTIAALGIFAGVACLVSLGRLLAVREPLRISWTVQLLVATGPLVLVGLTMLREWQHWRRPARDMAELCARARLGEVPIEELSVLRGGVEPLVPVMQDLLRDLRAQKIAVAELHEDYRQRVAARTLSLERTIGSLRAQATKDALTGLHNRRVLDEHLPRLVEQAKTDDGDLCVLMIDVDNFKNLNDTLGHAAGDALLRAIGQIIRSTVRENDLAIRNGGDEFVLILPGSGDPAGDVLAERLVSLVDGLVKPLRVKPAPRLSIGRSSLWTAPEPTAASLLASADAKLYEIKFARKAHERAGKDAKSVVRLAS